MGHKARSVCEQETAGVLIEFPLVASLLILLIFGTWSLGSSLSHITLFSQIAYDLSRRGAELSRDAGENLMNNRFNSLTQLYDLSRVQAEDMRVNYISSAPPAPLLVNVEIDVDMKAPGVFNSIMPLSNFKVAYAAPSLVRVPDAVPGELNEFSQPSPGCYFGEAPEYVPSGCS